MLEKAANTDGATKIVTRAIGRMSVLRICMCIFMYVYTCVHVACGKSCRNPLESRTREMNETRGAGDILCKRGVGCVCAYVYIYIHIIPEVLPRR